jgi:hypothetical protein
MEAVRQFFINAENNIHQVIIWIFNIIHTTIDCFEGMIYQWVANENVEEEDNNRGKKIGF